MEIRCLQALRSGERYSSGGMRQGWHHHNARHGEMSHYREGSHEFEDPSRKYGDVSREYGEALREDRGDALRPSMTTLRPSMTNLTNAQPTKS